MLIRFKTKYPPYNVNETAGFPVEKCIQLVKAGVAVFEDTPPLGYGPKAVDIHGFTVEDLDLSDLGDPVHLGGGNFTVAGVKIKGKAKALEILAFAKAKA